MHQAVAVLTRKQRHHIVPGRGEKTVADGKTLPRTNGVDQKYIDRRQYLQVEFYEAVAAERGSQQGRVLPGAVVQAIADGKSFPLADDFGQEYRVDRKDGQFEVDHTIALGCRLQGDRITARYSQQGTGEVVFFPFADRGDQIYRVGRRNDLDRLAIARQIAAERRVRPIDIGQDIRQGQSAVDNRQSKAVGQQVRQAANLITARQIGRKIGQGVDFQ